jgi:hypothetical protein
VTTNASESRHFEHKDEHLANIHAHGDMLGERDQQRVIETDVSTIQAASGNVYFVGGVTLSRRSGRARGAVRFARSLAARP